MTTTIDTFTAGPRTWADVEVNLARELPGYEPRIPQQVLALGIQEAMTEGAHLLAQAGCGTGKSIGGVVPMILAAKEQGTRVVVATATKALQEQYAVKDLPFLQEKSGIDFTWALVKGRSNYVCQAKLAGDDMERHPVAEAIREELELAEDHDGDREHFDTEIDDLSWMKLSSSSNECPGKSECPFGAICYAEKIKETGQQVDVVITNQAMLMTDVAIREKTRDREQGPVAMLGDYEMVLFDEGHELPEYAMNALGNDITGTGLALTVRDAISFASLHGTDLSRRAEEMSVISDKLSQLLVPLGGEAVTLNWFVENYEPFAEVMELLKMLRLDLQSLEIRSNADKENARRKILLTRTANALATLEELLMSEDADRVRWIETYEVRGELRWRMKVAPVQVGPWLSANLWRYVKAVVMSATLSAGVNRDGSKDFSYIQRTLGLHGSRTVDVGTPFDFGKQALMFVPGKEVPNPKDRQAWMAWNFGATLELIDMAKGGALLLFTSRAAMKASYETLSESLENRGLTALMQGDGRTNKELARVFKEDEHSVLFALKSFFVGVDIPGNACRLVIIDKMPFPVPTDPIFAARSLAEERAGRRPFSTLSIPMMTLTLEQGVGRLIRTRDDRGVVAIMDSRLSSTPYGRSIVNALPDFPVATKLSQVREFYDGKSFGR